MRDFRISRQRMFMDIASVVARRATCMRLNVGAIMVHDNSVVSIGYNGVPSGHEHCTGHSCDGWKSGCKKTIHAEMNALERAPAGLWNMDLYVTDSPCAKCWGELWDSRRIGRVFFANPYREASHLVDSLFHMEIYRVLPSGGIIDWVTGELVDEETFR